MPDARSEPTPHVLHVAPRERSLPAGATNVIARAGANIESCANVHVAMARIARRAPSLRTVIVAVDGLSTEEFEFFELVGRHMPRLPVLVYGDPPADSKVDRAVRAGARGPLVADDLPALLTGPPPVAGTPAPDTDTPAKAEFPPEVRRAADAERVDRSDSPAEQRGAMRVVGTPSAPRAPSGDQAPESPEAGEEDGDTSMARVPWHDYPRPVRTAPPRTTTPADDAVDHDDPLDQPLLTRDELAALIGENDGFKPRAEKDGGTP